MAIQANGAHIVLQWLCTACDAEAQSGFKYKNRQLLYLVLTPNQGLTTSAWHRCTNIVCGNSPALPGRCNEPVFAGHTHTYLA